MVAYWTAYGSFILTSSKVTGSTTGSATGSAILLAFALALDLALGLGSRASGGVALFCTSGEDGSGVIGFDHRNFQWLKRFHTFLILLIWFFWFLYVFLWL